MMVYLWVKLSISVFIIAFRSVFQEENNYYLQAHLHECLYEHEYDEYEDEYYSIVLMITSEKVNLNHTYYFFENIKNIDPYLLSINKKCMKNTDAVVYEIKYIMMQSINNQNIDKEVPPCLSFSDVDAYIIEEIEN